jgi:hypothetical protein
VSLPNKLVASERTHAHARSRGKSSLCGALHLLLHPAMRCYVVSCYVAARLTYFLRHFPPPSPSTTAVLATVNELVAQRLATAQGLHGQEPQEEAGTPTGVKSGGGGKKTAVKGSADAETAALLDRIAAAASTLAEHGAQRCSMAQENYDYVDALIVRLDKDLEACNAELVKHSDAQQAAAGGRRGKGAGLCACVRSPSRCA